MANGTSIVELGEVALSRAIHARTFSCAEVIAAYLDRIERLNPAVTTIVALQSRSDLMRQAGNHDAELAESAMFRRRSHNPGQQGLSRDLPLALKHECMRKIRHEY